MSLKNKVGCISVKILSLLLSIVSICYPFYCVIYTGVKPTLPNILMLTFIASIFFILAFTHLLKTNNPAYRWNIFTLDPSWTNKMEKSIEENPSQIFDFNKPTKEQSRDKKIKNLLRGK